MSITELSDHQPHIVINTGDAVHVIAVSQIRALANGECYLGDKSDMIRLLANGIIGLIDAKH